MLVAIALALGDVVGLALAKPATSSYTTAPMTLIGITCGTAGWLGVAAARSGDPVSLGRGWRVGLSLGFVALAGLAMGVRSVTRSLRACTSSLSANVPVVVAGTLLDSAPGRDVLQPASLPRGSPGNRTGLTRVRIGGGTLVSGGDLCRTSSLRAFVRPGVATLAAGSPVVVRGVWRTMGSAAFPRRPEAYGWLGSATIEPVGPSEVLERPRVLETTLAEWRGRLAQRLDARLTPRARDIGKALLLADRSTLAPDVRDTFVGAGIVHLLAISGLHVGFVGASIGWLLGLRIRGPRRLAYAAVLVSGYVLLIGAPPSAVRAALVFSGYAFAACRGRPARLSDLAALAGMLALLADPLLITDPGFQLSFAGFAGVVLGGRVRWPALRRPRHVRGLLRGLVVSTGAFLATAPIAAVHFDRLVIASIPASVVAGAVVGLTLPALVLALILPAPVWWVFAGAADALIGLLIWIAALFASLPLSWSGPGLGPRTWLIFASLTALGLDRAGGRRGLGVLAVGGAVALAWAGPAVRALQDRGEALICTLDVGQGDAAVVRTGAGRWLVFDAGPGSGFETDDASVSYGGPPSRGEAGRRVVAPFLRAMGAHAVELFALSHPHLDHFGGSAAVFDEVRVRRVLDPGVAEPSTAYLAFLERLQEEGSAWVAARAGDRFRLDDVELEVLWPRGPGGTDANEGSLSFRLTVQGFRYINSGDASILVERAILADNPRATLETDLLKLGHHGSRTSSALAWLRATRPKIAVISAGPANRYGHPHQTTIARLDSARVRRVWRTDVEGTLCIAIDENGWKIIPPPY